MPLPLKGATVHVDLFSPEGLLARFLAMACVENPRIEKCDLDGKAFTVALASGSVLRVTVERIR